MTQLRPAHWAMALALAMGLHLLALVALQSTPGFLPALRGGSLLEFGRNADLRRGIFPPVFDGVADQVLEEAGYLTQIAVDLRQWVVGDLGSSLRD